MDTKNIWTLIFGSLLAAHAQAAAIFMENAGNSYYDSGWTYSSSQPNNFGWFTITNGVAAPGYAGFAVQDSTGLASPGNYPNINTSGRAWRLFGSRGVDGTGTAEADAYGLLKDGSGNDAALSAGQTLSLDIAVNWRNGYKGFAARNAGGTELFTLNTGGDDYVIYNAATGNGSIGNTWSDNTVFHIAVTQTNGTGGVWTITRSGGVIGTNSGTYSGLVSNFKLYTSQTDAGSQNDFYANNIAVIGSQAITNVMSPVVSYQFYDALGDNTNATVISQIASYQYFDSPPAGSVNYLNSPSVSYDYPPLDTPLLTIIPTNRVPTTMEISSLVFLPSQLEVFQNGSFSTFVAAVDTNAMTIVLTHGWIPLKFWEFDLAPVFTRNGIEDWPTTMAVGLQAQGVTANIMAWNWESAATSPLNKPGQAGSQTPGQGVLLGKALLNVLGPNYSKPIHFVGHSFGTLVNSYAATYLQGTNFGNGQEWSSTPWPATNMQMTLFDEAEVGADASFDLDSAGLAALADLKVGFFEASSYYHPLPLNFAWADNYVSAFGLLKTNAANVILTDGFPTNAPDLIHWFYQLGSFHRYPCSWYSNTIQNEDISEMGFKWSFEQAGLFSQAPTNGSVYVQFNNNSPWDLTQKDWNYGTNYLNSNFQEYVAVAKSTAQIVGNIIDTSEQTLELAIFGVDGELLMNLNTTPEKSAKSQFQVHPLGVRPNGESNSSTNVPAYAWMELMVPTNAVSLSFNYIIQGDWQSDSLAAAFNGTNILLIAGNTIQTNVTFSSGSIDVSAFAGQTNEFFIGIIGGTSTNAQVTVENLAFSISTPPLLQAQTGNGNFMLSWPMSAANFNLQTATNLADPNSWVTLTNVPAIVNLQNTITNPITGIQGFYRLIQAQ